MRIDYPFLLFFSSVLFFSCNGEKTEDDLAHKTFEVFTEDDEIAFEELYAKQKDLVNLIESSSIPEEKKKEALERIEFTTGSAETFSKASFNNLRYSAYENGVNWQDVEITNIKSENTGFGYFGFQLMDAEKYGIEIKDIDITFESDGKVFVMRLEDCVKVPERGWCLTEEIVINRK